MATDSPLYFSNERSPNPDVSVTTASHGRAGRAAEAPAMHHRDEKFLVDAGMRTWFDQTDWR